MDWKDGSAVKDTALAKEQGFHSQHHRVAHGIPVGENLTPSSDLSRYQANTWSTDTRVGNTPIFIK